MTINSIDSHTNLTPLNLLPEVSFSFPNDGKEWKEAVETHDDTSRHVVFIPKEQSLPMESQEMIAISIMTHPTSSVEEIYQEFTQPNENFPGYESQLIVDEPNRIIFEWKSPTEEDKPYRLSLITKQNGTLFRLDYLCKEGKDTETLKAQYLPMLLEAKII